MPKLQQPHPSCPSNSDRVAMYDSVQPERVPTTAPVVCGYVDGQWPTYERFAATHRQSTVLSIATSYESDAMILDVERGDATTARALEWLERQRVTGVERPCLYMSLGAVRDFDRYASAHGRPRSSYRLWTAHWTARPHICGPGCGLGDVERPGATQWLSATAEGFDVSVTTWGWVRAVWRSRFS